MKDIIIAVIAKYIPTINPNLMKWVEIEHSIEDVKPNELAAFIESLNLPIGTETRIDCHVEIDGSECYQGSWPVLCYWSQVPTTPDERLKEIKTRVNNGVFKHIQIALLENGYKRIAISPSRNKKFPTVYDMYITGEHDLLTDYFLQYFHP